LKTFPFRYHQRKKSHGHFDRARSVYGMLSASLSPNGCSHNTPQQQSPDVCRSNTSWVLKTVEANQPHGTARTSLSLLQPAQCPLEMWEIFMLFDVLGITRVFSVCKPQLRLSRASPLSLVFLYSQTHIDACETPGIVFQVR